VTCPYGRPGAPHSPHEWGPALEPNYCPGQLATTDSGPLLILAVVLFLFALVALLI
jgi:hypothetical protein